MGRVRPLLLCVLAVPLVLGLGRPVAHAATVRLAVTDKFGHPVEGAQVLILHLGASANKGPYVTGPDGLVDIPGIPPGLYDANVSADGFVERDREPVVVPRGEPVVPVEIRLAGACLVFGIVRFGGAPPPLDDTVLVVQHRPGMERAPSRLPLGRDGEFSLTITEFEVAELWVRAEGFSWAKTPLAPAEDMVIEDMELVVEEPSATVAGTVMGTDGEPVPEAAVGLIREDVVEAVGAMLETFPVGSHAARWGRTKADENGHFQLEDVPAGEYAVLVGEPGSGRPRGKPERLRVEAGREVAINVVCARAAQGTAVFVGILRDTDGEVLGDHPFTYSYVALQLRGERSWSGGGQGPLEARSDPDGWFALETEGACDRGSLAVWGDGVGATVYGAKDADEGGLIDMSEVDTRKIAAVLADPDGGPLEGVELVLMGEVPRLGFTPQLTVVTDKEGRFGPVQLDERATALVAHGSFEGRCGVFPWRVELGEEDVADVSLTLPRPGSIAGEVVWGEGTTGSGLMVMVTGYSAPAGGLDASGRGACLCDVGRGETAWRLDGLLPGRYSIEAQGTRLLTAPGVEVEVKPGEEATATIEVPRAVTLVGQVTVEAGEMPETLRVSVAGSWREKPGWREIPVAIRDDGTFRLENVPASGVRFAVFGIEWQVEQRELESADEGVRRVEFRLRAKG